MGKRHRNPRLGKIHRNYTVEEVAGLFGVHRNAVRKWVKRGLPTNDDRRSMLILGRDLVAFLRTRRAKNKRTCPPGEICCRAPKAPAGDMGDYQPVTETLGNLIAIGSDCEATIYRRVSLAKLEQIRGQLNITMSQALPRNEPALVPAPKQYVDTLGTEDEGWIRTVAPAALKATGGRPTFRYEISPEIQKMGGQPTAKTRVSSVLAVPHQGLSSDWKGVVNG